MGIPYNTDLPAHLRALKEEIEGYARGFGLDFFETIFEVIDAEDLNEVAAYGGFPTRYPHWSFGMSYEELHKSYDYGLSKIYELVINNDPCYAYLMRSNHDVDQKLVMAHVYGHCLAPETLIETRDGVKPITEVGVGDEVLTHTGAYRRVRVCARRPYIGAIRCIRVADGNEPIRITPEHPVYRLEPVKTRTGASYKPMSLKYTRKAWLAAGWLHVGDRLVLPRVPVPVSAGSSSGHGFSFIAEHAESSCGDEEHLYPQICEVTTQDYDGYVYNFSVEEDESYTLAAGMVVHNCDFFKNNAYFAHTNRKMMDEMANHGTRIRRYAEKHGEDEVEAFMDRCMSIDDLIDVHSTAIRRRDLQSRYDFAEAEEEDSPKLTRFKSKGYMDTYINPREALKAEEEERKKVKDHAARTFPEHPEKDVLLFLIEHAPLKPWQRDVLSIVRDEAYYFAPQAQTKVMNEGWACLKAGSLVNTDRGLLPIEEIVQQRLVVQVSDGQDFRQVYDWARFEDRETVYLRTRRGLELEGSRTHQVMFPDGSWRRLDEVRVGDRLLLSSGLSAWPKEPVPIAWQPPRRLVLTEVAARAGVDVETVIRFRRGVRGRFSDRLAPLVAEYEAGRAAWGRMQNNRRQLAMPRVLDEKLAAFLGYLVGDGHLSQVKRTIGLTTGDEDQADRFVELTRELFGLTPRKHWDEGRWRVGFSSRNIEAYLQALGLKTGFAARVKEVPAGILRSPREVVAAFLRAYFDCDGHAGPQGVILSTASESLSKTVQLLLLNFGILSRRRPQTDGCWHLDVTGQSAAVYSREIGFGLTRKQEALRAYLDGHHWFKKEEWEDEVVALEGRHAEVFDISVEETHRYAAQGFVNHNSYWHSTIMTQKALKPSEFVDFADHHSGTMATYGARLNPYKLGIELFRNIEHRWDTGKFGKEYEECDDLEKRRTWNKNLGLGRQKIFEARRVHNDITFIETFLTPDFCREHKMFSYAFQDQAGQYVIESREFHKIKQRLLFSLTNFGKPWIFVVDGNYRNRAELLLRHEHNGIDLRQDWAAATLANIQFIWNRPVHLQTIVEGKPTLLSFDGSEHSTRHLGESDEPKRSGPTKSR